MQQMNTVNFIVLINTINIRIKFPLGLTMKDVIEVETIVGILHLTKKKKKLKI